MDGNHAKPAIPSSPFRWFPEFLDILRRRSRSQARLLPLAVVVGIVAGLGGYVFTVACQAVVRVSLDEVAGYRPHGPAGEAKVSWIPESSSERGPDRPLLLLVTPVVGGLLSGWLVFKFAPEAEGHGTDAVISAYHYHQGEIRARVPLIKIIASALTIGTGGSGGREGPIAQIGAGFGSLLGRLLKLRPAERRILLAAGMGAGIAAIFRAPLAGALFAAEVLYGSPEFEPEVILPAGLASVVSYGTFGLVIGRSGSLFELLRTTVTPEFDVRTLIAYTILAVAMPTMAMVYTRTFYWITHLFHKLRIPRMLKPAIGAGLTGAIGVGLYFAFRSDARVLSVMSFGYGILQDTMRDTGDHAGRFLAALLLAVALGKILTTSLTIGSGGSGGVFGPSMVIGGCAAGALGLVLRDVFRHVWPEAMPDQVSFMIVGMAGFFAAAAKTPFSTLIIVCELTGNYNLIVPALWVCTVSFLLSDEQSLYSSQVPGRANSPAHQGAFIRAILTGHTVGQVLSGGGKVAPLKPDDHLDTVIDRFDTAALVVLPVVDANNRLLGVVHLNELFWTTRRREELTWILAIDLMRGNVKPLTPELTLEEAVELFAENDLPELPVVTTDRDRTLVGMVRRTDIAKAYLRRVHAPRAID
jgi:CIC family chloride channel protein